MQDTEFIFEAKDIVKTFPGVKALKGIQLRLKSGEVHALMGENGAGKSTLMKIILGTHQPTSGAMIYKGEPYAPKAPADALEKGIAMIHQEISLVPAMTVAENVWLGREGQFGSKASIKRREMEKATEKLLNQIGIRLSPGAVVENLSIAQMQLVEIARAVSYEPEIIIMDEPTSALTDVEVELLLKIIRDLKASGKSVVYISHKLEEVMEIADRATVFRDGTYVCEMTRGEITKDSLVSNMVGRAVENVYPKEEIEIGKTILKVEHLTAEPLFRDISFEVHAGEILGFAGLMGAGRTEIMRAIFGKDKKDSGKIYLHGKEINLNNTTEAVQNGIAMITEDRLHSGLIHIHSVKQNASLAYLPMIAKKGIINRKKEKQDVLEMVDKLSIKVATVDSEAGQLSGGNQQKVIIAKWLLTQPDVLIMDEPTRGIDVGAKAEIYKLMGLMAKQGKAIIMISSELPELMGVSDRIEVIHNGEITGEYLRNEFDQEKILASAFGIE